MSITWGSSPRVRGSRMVHEQEKFHGGIIPAGAGLTLIELRAQSAVWDHPRGCGAHRICYGYNRWSQGSSPRVRGSQEPLTHGSRDSGIIPAGAGLTLADTAKTSTLRDHPRGCGAHWHSLRCLFRHRGSSPRVRGSHTSFEGAEKYQGIIPAGAGLTTPHKPLPRALGDHPRGCGAHSSRTFHKRFCWGSSPRVRGSQ